MVIISWGVNFQFCKDRKKDQKTRKKNKLSSSTELCKLRRNRDRSDNKEKATVLVSANSAE
jgi:hypothetical protein